MVAFRYDKGLPKDWLNRDLLTAIPGLRTLPACQPFHLPQCLNCHPPPVPPPVVFNGNISGLPPSGNIGGPYPVVSFLKGYMYKHIINMRVM